MKIYRPFNQDYFNQKGGGLGYYMCFSNNKYYSIFNEFTDEKFREAKNYEFCNKMIADNKWVIEENPKFGLEYLDLITNISAQKIQINSKIKFVEEKQKYTIKSISKDGRYLICTKPFNARKTCLYTIVDLEEGIRGRNNMIFNPYEYSTQKDIDECMRDLENGEVEISYRHRIGLKIEE